MRERLKLDGAYMPPLRLGMLLDKQRQYILITYSLHLYAKKLYPRDMQKAIDLKLPHPPRIVGSAPVNYSTRGVIQMWKTFHLMFVITFGHMARSNYMRSL